MCAEDRLGRLCLGLRVRVRACFGLLRALLRVAQALQVACPHFRGFPVMLAKCVHLQEAACGVSGSAVKRHA